MNAITASPPLSIANNQQQIQSGLQGELLRAQTQDPSVNNASAARLNAQVAQQVASAGAGSAVDVQYTYAAGPDGSLVVSSAVVTITEEKSLAEGGRLVQPGDIEDIIDIRSQTPSGAANGEASESEESGLNASERDIVRQLQASDAAVRNHEGLHFRAAGGLAASPNYETVQGPDGNFYAVAGSVDVSGTRGADPEQAAREAQTLQIAATAPADASAQDIAAARIFGQQLGGARGDDPAQAEDSAATTAQRQENPEPGETVDFYA